MLQQPYDAVLLIAYGGPESMDEVRPFLHSVLGGKAIPPERVEEVVEHYRLIGGKSPVNELTFDQAERLRAALAEVGDPLPVYVGMRYWRPRLADTLRQMAEAGVRRAIGVILAVQQCDSSWQRYQREVADARQAVGPDAPQVEYLDSWHDHPLFIEAAADQVREALGRLTGDRRDEARIVFTAHSIPQAMDGADQYVRQVRQGAERVAAELGRSRWSVAYQSRSGNPRDPWLEPDICDVLAELGRAGDTAAVLMPIGFVCDHLEVLYDLDIKARQAAEQAGITIARAKTVGTHPTYIRMFVELIVARYVGKQRVTTR